MEINAIALLIVAGMAMGFVNNVAGGGGLIGLLAFELVVDLTTVEANTSLRPAALALGIMGLIGYLGHGQAIPLRAWAYGLAAAPGAVIGAMLAVSLPPWVYQTTLIVVVGVISKQQLRPRKKTNSTAPHKPPGLITEIILFTLVGLHMGFVQVAFGLLTIAVLTKVLQRDLVTVNAAKMAIVITTALTSNIYFSTVGAIHWEPALWLALGSGSGSLLASRWSIKKGHGAVRTIVLVVCAFFIVRLAVQTAMM